MDSDEEVVQECPVKVGDKFRIFGEVWTVWYTCNWSEDPQQPAWHISLKLKRFSPAYSWKQKFYLEVQLDDIWEYTNGTHATIKGGELLVQKLEP